MAKGKINIGKVKGDFIISQGQSGGVTGHTINSAPQAPKKKSWKKIAGIIAAVASIVSILGYFGISPLLKAENKLIHQDTVAVVKPGAAQERIIHKTPIKSMNNDQNKEKPISIGDVSGNVIISQNQSGGITAHTVVVNKPLPRELNGNDKNTLLGLDRTYSISVTAIGGNESQNYGVQIFQLLKSNGYNTELNFIMNHSPEPEPGRFIVTKDPASKTVLILIPKEGVGGPA